MFYSQEVLGQASTTNFSEISLGLCAGYPTIKGELGEHYSTNGIYGINVKTNYGIGYFSLQANFQENLPNQLQIPYNTWFFGLNYLAKVNLPNQFYFLIGPGLGNAYFRFYPNQARKKYYFESEFFINAEISLHKKIGKRFIFYVGFYGTKVFTNPQYLQTDIKGGLNFSFPNASTLQKWMQ